MREILFRGKRVDNGEWVYGDVRHNYDNEPRCISDYCGGNPVDPATVGQYTGLTANGKMIFEHDIVRINGNPLDLAVIRFGEFGCVDIEEETTTDYVNGWYYEPLKTDAISMIDPFCMDFQLNKFWIEQTKMEIIGNIHDNPEMLKGANDEKA